MFIRNEEISAAVCGKGVKRKVLSRGGSLMTVEVSFEKDSIGAVHTHKHEQISYILSGSFEYNLNGEKVLLRQGDSVYVKPALPHGTVALEDNSVILDIFSPQREDFLNN